MREAHKPDNAQALIRQKHPAALKILTAAKGGKLSSLKVSDKMKQDFIMRGTSYDHVLAVAKQIAATSKKEVKDNA